MPKGYFLSAHRSPANPKKRQAYLELAGPAMIKAGGKMLASTSTVDAHENGVVEQTVLVEFESLEKAGFNSLMMTLPNEMPRFVSVYNITNKEMADPDATEE